MFRSLFLSFASMSLLLLSAVAGQAETPTMEELISKLQNKPQAPGAGVTAGSKGSPRRDNLPSADLEIYFDFDSAAIAPPALPVLTTLGSALSDGRLAGGTFVVAGHTDAKGDADYNQRLSQQRAQAVREFLISNFPIAPNKLLAVGYGEQQLKAPQEPIAAVNRRVQVINWTTVGER